MDFDPDKIDLSILLSFPRSGSNFLQNIVKQNATGIQCTSIAARGDFLRPKACLKSHAINEALLAAELRDPWNRHEPRNATIILTRDPRDVMISYYDLLPPVFGDEITPASLFEHDFEWIKSEYRSRKAGVSRENHQDRAPATQPVYSVLDALGDWHKNWTLRPRRIDWHYVSFEDLLADPGRAFGGIFDHLNLPRLEEYQGLQTLVSQHGDSTRPRGKAGGWRNAPSFYDPIIEQTNIAMGAVCAELGYRTR